jgi:hypothetical protein
MDELFDLAAPDSDAVVGARLDLVAAALDGPQVLGRFTDEELVGLAEPGAEPMAPSPWYSSLTEDEQVTALTAALRGLTARGVYRAQPVDAETGAFAFEADAQILALLTMRRHTETIVVAERRTADLLDWAVLYRQRDGLWLTELVTHVGQHAFTLAGTTETVDALTAWCGARPDVEAPELDLLLTRAQVAAQDPALDPVGLSTAAVTITRLDFADTVTESWSGVFTGPDGAYLSTAVGDDVAYRGADREAVLAFWRQTLAAD